MKNNDNQSKKDAKKSDNAKETTNSPAGETTKPPVTDPAADTTKEPAAETNTGSSAETLPETENNTAGSTGPGSENTKRKLSAEDMQNNPEFAAAGLKEGDEVEMGPEAISAAKKAMTESLAKTKNGADLGTDKDGTPKLSVNETLNIVSKSIIHIFTEHAKTSLPKITPTQVEKLLEGYEGIKINWQFADLNKTKGRLALVSIDNAQDHVLLPLDINEEWEFGVDYELMAKEAHARGEEFGEKELAAAKAKAELDENDKNRLSVEHLNEVAKTIEGIFAERETTCLPKLTDKDVMHVLRNQAKTIDIQVHYKNEEDTEGYYLLKEFQNEVRVPKEGVFNFSIDNERIAKKREDALAAEREAAKAIKK